MSWKLDTCILGLEVDRLSFLCLFACGAFKSDASSFPFEERSRNMPSALCLPGFLERRCVVSLYSHSNSRSIRVSYRYKLQVLICHTVAAATFRQFPIALDLLLATDLTSECKPLTFAAGLCSVVKVRSEDRGIFDLDGHGRWRRLTRVGEISISAIHLDDGQRRNPLHHAAKQFGKILRISRALL